MKNLKLTFKTWPVIAGATIGLCFATKAVAELLGVKLPDQANLELVRKCLGWNWRFAFVCAQVLVIVPVLEELLFRGLLFRFPCKDRPESRWLRGVWALVSAGLFSAAHYLSQPWPDSAFVALFFFGLAQCWLYVKTGRLWCAILNHSLFNLLNLVLLFVVPV